MEQKITDTNEVYLTHRIQPIARSRIHDQISFQIKTMIDEGLLKPGDRLPSERDLAERFKVSRNSVRDALRTLEARGILIIQQGGGTFVADLQESLLIQSLLDAIMTEKEQTKAILQVRQIVEPGIAYEAALYPSTDQISLLEEIINAHEEKSKQGDPGVLEDSLFHNSIAKMTGNHLLVMMLQILQENIENTRDILLNYSGSATRIGHRRILQAIKDHNPEAARNAMKEHLDEVMVAFELIEFGSPHKED